MKYLKRKVMCNYTEEHTGENRTMIMTEHKHYRNGIVALVYTDYSSIKGDGTGGYKNMGRYDGKHEDVLETIGNPRDITTIEIETDTSREFYDPIDPINISPAKEKQ